MLYAEPIIRISMKKFLFYMSLAALLVPSACKSKKDVQTATGSTEISIPFSGSKYRSDKDNFRAVANANSPNLNISRQNANLNAKGTLAGLIKDRMQVVGENYANGREIAADKEASNRFQQIIRSAVDQTLIGVEVMDEKSFQEKDGSYTSWVALSVDKETVLTGAYKGINADKKLEQDFDQKKFREVFDTEMKKLQDEKSK